VGYGVVLRYPARLGLFLLTRVAQARHHPERGPARFYVLGDNAAASRDSRVFGPVARRQIVGKAWLRY
jgi:type IV secretory pathway protease TraF